MNTLIDWMNRNGIAVDALPLDEGEKWITTRNNHRVKIDEDGTVEAGFGGRFTGQKISEARERTSGGTESASSSRVKMRDAKTDSFLNKRARDITPNDAKQARKELAPVQKEIETLTKQLKKMDTDRSQFTNIHYGPYQGLVTRREKLYGLEAGLKRIIKLGENKK